MLENLPKENQMLEDDDPGEGLDRNVLQHRDARYIGKSNVFKRHISYNFV